MNNEIKINAISASCLFYLLLMLLTWPVAEASDKDDRDRIIDNAFEQKDVLFSAGRFAKAVELANKILSLNPSDEVAAAAYYMRGESYENQGKYAAAVKDFTKALELDPKNLGKQPPVYYNLGTALYKLGYPAEALLSLNKAIQLYPQYGLAYNQRGSIYGGLGKYEIALADFNKAIDLEPQDSAGYFGRGMLYYSWGKLEASYKDLTKAIELNPTNIVAHMLIVGIYSQQNNEADACRWLRRTIDNAKKKGFNNWDYIRKSQDYEKLRTSSCYKELMN